MFPSQSTPSKFPDARDPTTVKFDVPRHRLYHSDEEFGTSKLTASRCVYLADSRIDYDYDNDNDSDHSSTSTSTVRRLESQHVSNRAYFNARHSWAGDLFGSRSSSTAARVNSEEHLRRKSRMGDLNAITGSSSSSSEMRTNTAGVSASMFTK